MPASKRVKREPRLVDVLVTDREDRPIVVGEARWKPIPESVARSLVKDSLTVSDRRVPFVLIADRDRIRLYRGGEEWTGRPVFSSDTDPILGYYARYYEETRPRPVGDDLFLELVLVWIRDLSYRWMSRTSPPPAFEELDRLGLVPLLKDALFNSEARSGGYRLHRDELPDRPDPWTGA